MSGVVTRRSILIGLLLVPLNVYWVIVSELRWYTVLTLNPLFITPVFYLFLLVTINSILRRIAPKYLFQPAELVVIYIMLVISCTIATHDYIINLMSTIGWPSWFSTPENQWNTRMFPYLPQWLFVWDKKVLSGYFNGHASLADPAVLRAWLAPLAFWSVFIFSVGWMMLCLNVIIRKAWVEDTKLSFPIVRLPLALTESSSPSSMLRSPALWMGFGVAAGISLLGGLHMWYPNIPEIRVRSSPVPLVGPMWSSMDAMCVTFYPFAIGLAYLVPLAVSFSCWFFYLFSKAQGLIGWQLGYSSVPGFPFVSDQAIGAWTTFGFSLLYLSRKYLRNVVRLALHPEKGADADEPMSYRMAFCGLIAGMLVFTVFWRAAGMGIVWVLLALGAYLLLSLCITRVRAEAGGQHSVLDLEPRLLFSLFSSDNVGHTTMAAAAMSHWYWRFNRSHMMPSQLESFKLAQEHGINLRSLVLPMLAALALAIVFGMWACLHIFYTEGATKCLGFTRWTGAESYDWLDSALKNGFQPQAARWGAVSAAAGFTVFLAWMQARFSWWPFHPLGYCIGPGLYWMWCPFLIAWAIKLAILRYGGLKLYRRTLPFFLGLILGDYTMGAVWSLISIIWRVRAYQPFH